ncbi:hypothetical protein D3C86_1038060 [compost metagenome]
MAPAQRVFEIVSDVLVELLVFLVLDLGTRTGPQGTGAVDGFPLNGRLLFAFGGCHFFRQLDRQGDVIGVLFDDVAQTPAIGKLVFSGFQVQDDASAALGFLNRCNFEIAFALGRPVHAFACGAAGTTAVHVDFVGDDECGVETDTELADQVRVFLLVAGQVLHEIGGAGLGDGTQVGDRVFAAHADTVVFEGDGFSVLVEAHADFQFGATFQQLWLGQGFET